MGWKLFIQICVLMILSGVLAVVAAAIVQTSRESKLKK